MNYGLQLSASGVMTSLYRQDVVTNNLANVNTVGFKPDVVTTRQRDPASIEDNLPFLPTNTLIERLGGGVMMAPNRTAFTQGGIRQTNRDLDLAIKGEGFFVVSDASDGKTDRLRLMRDGRMTRDSRGRLVTISGGLPVMDVRNRPIVLPEAASVRVQPDGSIMADGQRVAQIQLTAVTDLDALDKRGGGLYFTDAQQMANRRPATGLIQQGAVEESAVNAIKALMDVTSASKAVAANAQMIRFHDQLMDRAINQLGRVG
jgi:flagellar basal body rod protein FlgG